MDQLQAKLYKLLVEVDEICKKNDITYYLAGGTALGAIRGGGFLPWDDDIDLYITRKNWNKLVKVMEEQTPENRIFVCNENTDLYWNPVGRYVDLNTTVMMKSQMLCGKACGQLIEFFIMDPMPLDEDAKWEHRKMVKAYAELLTPYFVIGRNIFTDNTDYDFDLYDKYYKKAQSQGRDKVLQEMLDKITSVEEEDSDYYCMRWGIRTLMYGKDLLAEPRMEKFEEGMFPIPAKQEEVARIAYGDSWMYVPEGAGKVVHGLDKDLMTPFQKYVDIYMPLIDKEKLLKSNMKNKRIRTEALLKKNEFKREFAKARAKVAAKWIKENDYDLAYLRNLLDDNKLDELGSHLQYFYREQSNPEIKANRVLIPVDDEYIFVAIMYHILRGDYYKANGIMSYRCNLDKPLDEELQKAKELIDFCHDLSVAVYDKRDTSLVKELLNNNIKYKDVLVDYARAELWLMNKEAISTDDYEKLVEYAMDRVNHFGEDGEILSFWAYGLYNLERFEESKEQYKIAITKTRNGFVWKQANELFGIDAYEIVDNSNDEEDEEDDTEEDLDEK